MAQPRLVLKNLTNLEQLPPNGSQEYAFAIVAGVVRNGAKRSWKSQPNSDFEETAQEPPGLDQVVVYLYEPDGSTTYVDRYGAQALFSFDLSEISEVELL